MLVLVGFVCSGGFDRGTGRSEAAVQNHQRGFGAGGAVSSSMCAEGGEQGPGKFGEEPLSPPELPAVPAEQPPHAGGSG